MWNHIHCSWIWLQYVFPLSKSFLCVYMKVIKVVKGMIYEQKRKEKWKISVSKSTQVFFLSVYSNSKHYSESIISGILNLTNILEKRCGLNKSKECWGLTGMAGVQNLSELSFAEWSSSHVSLSSTAPGSAVLCVLRLLSQQLVDIGPPREKPATDWKTSGVLDMENFSANISSDQSTILLLLLLTSPTRPSNSSFFNWWKPWSSWWEVK